MNRARFVHLYEDIISVENLLEAWGEFLKGKRYKPDVQEFGRHLMRNILALHKDLKDGTYRHGGYRHFKIADPKPRDIHKASVRDRLVHHALHRKLYPFFDRTFIADSYSCRVGKGTHRAMDRFRTFARQIAGRSDKNIWVLKCDIRKFFASIDHAVLIGILRSRIADERICALLEGIITSFSIGPGKGLPLGNLTSQLFVNVYMNEFDQFAKHQLKTKYYIRYADDFVFLSQDKIWLSGLIPRIEVFLWERLCLTLHPKKISIRTWGSGIDFLGWMHFPDHRILRTNTKRRVFRGIDRNPKNEHVLSSYLGLIGHGNTYKLKQKLLARAGSERKE